ncbi:hypothetical protein SPRG_07770 [Saprolegnia parasitica CBS 223.65]|uniref:Uncharacterized protein n=1 Tax=Saprolegnia parasitica (strain CBS 223.65) TaxID=695850 RepID=A0A067C8G2_SAPPC|nr:hypothetical protein SPRG_07770 [Saprolegnia parasitica CBS 223.65]KDO27059.1 hypothetical protein SPRG_07770 [Saprolegnia parasitica CBS 223.65]|eukprot:XP_012202154.1 hypothetical protein SPRG_07770 [Saprolegnia parasitica CBS 223.65]
MEAAVSTCVVIGSDMRTRATRETMGATNESQIQPSPETWTRSDSLTSTKPLIRYRMHIALPWSVPRASGSFCPIDEGCVSHISLWE